MWAFILRPAAFLFLASFSLIAQSPKPVMGISPAEALSLLPATPPGWKLASSRANNQVSAHPALLTVAMRKYVLPPEQGNTSALPKLTNVTLLDTAFDPDRLFAIQLVQKPKNASDGSSQLVVGGVPVTVQKLGEGRRKVSAALASRFLLVAVLENQDDKDQEFWLSQLNLPKLELAARSASTLAPTPDFFTVIAVDEMNPAGNQTAKVPYQTGEQRATQEEERRREASQQGATSTPAFSKDSR